MACCDWSRFPVRSNRRNAPKRWKTNRTPPAHVLAFGGDHSGLILAAGGAGFQRQTVPIISQAGSLCYDWAGGAGFQRQTVPIISQAGSLCYDWAGGAGFQRQTLPIISQAGTLCYDWAGGAGFQRQTVPITTW
jgi:hypothetical protein